MAMATATETETITILCPCVSARPGTDVWFACGTVNAPVRIKGSVWTADGKTQQLEGRTILCCCTGGKNGKAVFRWVIKFQGQLNGERLLRVEGTGKNSLKVERPINAPAAAPAAAAPAAAAALGFDIQSPNDNDDITASAASFMAFGPLTGQTSVVLATMNGGATTIDADFINNDGDNDIWVAGFPPLSPDTYRLDVEDDTTTLKSRSGLLVQ